MDALQTGTFKVYPDSKRETPYMIGNHMIAASVTGKCTDHPDKLPDIRQYEAQDLVVASFLKIYSEHPDMHPAEVKKQACMKWYGHESGLGAPMPKEEDQRRAICALAQMDMFFVPEPRPHLKYSLEEAMKRCKDATQIDNPCFGNIKPPDEEFE